MFVQLNDRFIEITLTWGWLVCLAAWRALPLVLIVIGLKLALRQRLAPSVHALLWTIVLVRFLLPIAPGTPVSVHALTDKGYASLTNESEQQQLPLRAELVDFVRSAPAEEPATWDLQQVDARQGEAPTLSWEVLLAVGFCLVLVMPTVAMLLRGAIAHVRFAVKLRSCRVLEEQTLIDTLLRECDQLRVGRRPVVCEVPELSVPAVFGVLRHTICLPPGLIDSLSTQELRWVLRHELAHIRRRDVLVSVIGSVVTACHWFNPFAWLTAYRLRAAMEVAADRLALTNLTASDAHAYGLLLLRLAEGDRTSKRTPTLGLLPFASGKYLKQRISLLPQSAKPATLLSRLVAALLVVGIMLTGLSDAREAKVLKQPELHLPLFEGITAKTEGVQLEPWNFKDNDSQAYVKSYDIESLSATIPKELSESGLDRKQLVLRWLPLPTQISKLVSVDEHTLVAELNAEQHELLDRTLKAWERGEPKQIVIDTRFIVSDLHIASSIDWAGQRIDSLAVERLGPAIAARIGEPELKRLIQSAQDDRRTNIICAPRITTFAAQTATIASQVQRPFVTGADPRQPGVLQPVISLIDEGLKLTFTPEVRDDGGLKLTFDVKATSIGKVSYANLPIRLPHESEPRFTVQVPSTEQFAISSTVDLKANESVVVAIPHVFNLEPGADTDTTILVTLTPRVIER